MRSRTHRLIGFALGAAVAVAALASGCQAYELDPVQPKLLYTRTQEIPITGTKKRPNVVVVLDRSGSMMEPATGGCSPQSLACCSADGLISQYCPPSDPRATCKNSCKWNDMLKAMTDPTNGFLTLAKAKARFALIAFPEGNLCAAPSQLKVGLPNNPTDDPALDNNAQKVIDAINAMTPGGGTPTAGALNLAANMPDLVEAKRDSFVVLITDGLPNCNVANQPKCDQCCATCNACQAACDLTKPPCRGPVNADGSTQYCNPTASSCGSAQANLCLDGGATVQAVRTLFDKGVKTLVIGFGTFTAAVDSGPVLDAAAIAGGVPCTQGTTKYCQAGSQADLREILDKFQVLLETCTYTLSEAPDGQLVVVKRYAKDATEPTKSLVADTDFRLSGNTVTVIGDECKVLQDAQPGAWTLKFSFVKNL